MSNEKAEIAIINCTFERLDPSKRCEPLTHQFIYQGPAKEFCENMIELCTAVSAGFDWVADIPYGGDEWVTIPTNYKPEVKEFSKKKYKLQWHTSIHEPTHYGMNIISGRNVIVFDVKENFNGLDCTVTATCDYPPYMPYFRYLLKECGQTLKQSTEANSEVPQNEQQATARRLLLDTEEQLRTAIYDIVAAPSTSDWWAAVAQLYHQFKATNLKYTYGRFAALLGMDEKHVGKMIRQHPKSP